MAPVEAFRFSNMTMLRALAFSTTVTVKLSVGPVMVYGNWMLGVMVWSAWYVTLNVLDCVALKGTAVVLGGCGRFGIVAVKFRLKGMMPGASGFTARPTSPEFEMYPFC